MLLYLYDKTASPGDNIDITDPPLQAALQTFDQKYIGTIADYLTEERWAKAGRPGSVDPFGQRLV